MAKKKSRNLLLFYLATVGGLVAVYWKFSQLSLLSKFFAASGSIWLFILIGLQFLTYICLALNYQAVLKIKGTIIKFRELLPMTVIVQFLNQALPSAGVSGQAFFIQYLKRHGLTVVEGIGRAILEIMTLFMAFGSYFIFSIIVLEQTGVLAEHQEFRIIFYVFLALALLTVAIFFLSQKRRQGRVMSWLVDKISVHFDKKEERAESNYKGIATEVANEFKENLNIKNLKKKSRIFWLAYFWQMAIILLDALTLYFICLVIGFKITFIKALVGFTLTYFISMISFVPGALGIFEGGMTIILKTLGMPGSAAFSATILLRSFTFWLPMPFGWYFYHRFIRNGKL